MNDVVGKLTKQQQDAVGRGCRRPLPGLPDMVRHVGTETFHSWTCGCTSYMRFVGLEWSYGSSEVDRFHFCKAWREG